MCKIYSLTPYRTIWYAPEGIGTLKKKKKIIARDQLCGGPQTRLPQKMEDEIKPSTSENWSGGLSPLKTYKSIIHL